jgi:hypothetical protein
VALLINSKLFGAAVTAAVSLAAAFAGVAGASSSGSPATVTVRVEGLTKTLLVPAKVTTHTGSITKNGTPAGACPATSAAGALDVATHHNWSGDYDKKFAELEVISILGESHPFTPAKDYWELFVNNVAAQAGVCDVSLHSGDQVLFAAVPDTGPSEFPIVVQAPKHATVGKAFTAKVAFYNAKGKREPLAGATVSGAGKSVKTTHAGTVRLKPTKTGTLVLKVTKKGYIRSAPAPVPVAS